MGEGVHQDKGADPLGMGHREMNRPRAGGVSGHYRRSLETGRIEHGDQISVEGLSRHSVPGVTLRRAQAPGVEPNCAAESSQPPLNPDESGIFAQDVERLGNAGVIEHQVERPVAAHLVSEVGPIG